MLEDNISGADIMPNATHLTAAALASTHADIKLTDTRILTAPYGLMDDAVVTQLAHWNCLMMCRYWTLMLNKSGAKRIQDS